MHLPLELEPGDYEYLENTFIYSINCLKINAGDQNKRNNCHYSA